MAMAGELITTTGEGIKGDSLMHSVSDDSGPQIAAMGLATAFGR